MSEDQAWRNCEGTWDRLRWARKRKFGTAIEAAASLGLDKGTYGAYERHPDSSKHIGLDHQKAMFLAKRMGVRWEWLLLGTGDPHVAPPGSPEEQVLEAMGQVEPDKLPGYTAAILALLKTGTSG